MPRPPHIGLMQPLKSAIVRQVLSVFHDRSGKSTPVVRSDDALFRRDSVSWRVHGDVTSMLVGGVSSLMLQMLHPAALAGVWDHSNFRDDMQGRLRRTARFIALTTYAERGLADAAIDRVRRIHHHVGGTLPDGTRYSANDPRLLAWVHVTEATSFLDAWVRYGEPGMSSADQDRYFAEFAQVAERLGADPVPRGRAEARRLIESFRPELHVDARTREVARLLLDQPAPTPSLKPFQMLTMQAGVDLLPGWARRLHGLPSPALQRPLVRAGTLGVAQTLRWALAR